ncbi:hemerythrin domain-containing protein [Cellulomonas edaphi]|uniref:Hemerythrin domain-containing protein n=1 Tax=Cellulomonas edaphi TaxID=3053468 RepID=A0ABT7S433_9CELL|nr:hemerythrin domain-containing protein [Cellulomons edaphi]MDM7830383.1 hemerythrin domain-containing protein [Cellulomons edaphi]
MTTADEPERVLGWGQQLIQVHDALRADLARVRESLGEPGVTLAPDVRLHCATFCQAVGEHHTREDAGMFPALAAAHPELRETLDGLAQDHVAIHSLLGRLETVLQTAGAGGATDDLRAEVDGLAALLVSHLAWEERALVAALDATPR